MATEETLKILESIFPGNVWYRKLSSDEKKVIKDWREHVIFEIIYGMPPEIREEIAKSVQVKAEYYEPYMKEQKDWGGFFEDCFCQSKGISKDVLKSDDCSPELQAEEFQEFMQSDMYNIFSLYNLARNPSEIGELYHCPRRVIFQMQVDFHRERYKLDKTEI